MTRALLVVLLVLVAGPAPAYDGGVTSDVDAGAAPVDDDDDAAPTPEPDPRTFGVVYRPGVCARGGSSNLNGMIPVLDEIRGRGTTQSTFGGTARIDPSHVAWNDARFVEPGPADAFFDEERGPPTVVEERFPFLETAEELVFQVPFHGERDWLRVIEEGAPLSPWVGATVRRMGRLVSYPTSKGPVLVLEPDEPIAAFDVRTRDAPDEARHGRTFAGETRFEVGGATFKVFSIGKRYGLTERVVEDVRAARAALPAGRAITVWPGGALDDLDDEEAGPVCRAVLEKTEVEAYVPSAGDLLRGPSALVVDARQAGLPLVVTNLSAKDDGAAFPSERLITLDDGRLVVVLGAVGASVLSHVPADVRARYHYRPPVDAVSAALDAIRDRLGRSPDLVIVVSSGSAEEAATLGAHTAVDIVIGDAMRFDLVEKHEVVEIGRARGGREGVGRMAPALVTRAGHVSVGRITAFFDDDGLRTLTHDSGPVTHDGWADPELHVLVDEILRGARVSQVVLPDAAPLVDADPALAELVFGERVLVSGRFRSYTRALPPRYTDALWMRIVGNVVRERLDVDAVVLRNLPRDSSVTGPVVRDFVEGWLPEVELLEVVTLTGADLRELLGLVAASERDLARPGSDVMFVAGADPRGLVVGGRPVAPELRYRVAITDALRGLPEAERVLARAVRTERAFHVEDGYAAADDDGAPLRLKPFVLAVLDETAASEDAAPTQVARVTSWLADASGTLQGEWQLRIDELAATGSAYRNTSNITDFQASRETRTTTPDLYNVGLRLRSSLVHDGPWLAWDTGARALYNAIILDFPDGTFPRSEPLDDIVLYSELRLNRVRLSFDDGNYTVAPFTRVAFDTEFTATTDPTDPTRAFPHQALAQQSVGLVAYLGPVVREARLGLVVQEDLSEGLVAGGQRLSSIHLDAGVTFGLRLQIPFWIFRLESETDGRYLAPDPDDRIADLALRLQSVNKLVVPLGQTFSVFGFADVFVVSGKLDANRALGASAVFGAGVEFRDVWRL